MTASTMMTSIQGRRLGINPKGALVGNERLLTSEAADAVITVGAEVTDVRAITIQLTDANGVNLSNAEIVDVYMFTTAAHTALATTGGSTGIAIGASGAILRTLTAKKQFECITTAAGLLALTYTDTATETVCLGVRLPTGVWVYTAAFANA